MADTDVYSPPANALRRGQIVRHRQDGRRGVVVDGPLRPGQRVFDIPFPQVGDVVIRQSRGTVTVTNAYDEWETIPSTATTAEERLIAAAEMWERPDWLDEGEEPQDIDTPVFAWIQALIPERVRDSWERDGYYPTSVFELLGRLAGRLDAMAPPYEPEATGPTGEGNR